tara:strand:+ start:40909 stop:41097 length:189 start_codon:yes stop_codon:yes gene_type:complete
MALPDARLLFMIILRKIPRLSLEHQHPDHSKGAGDQECKDDETPQIEPEQGKNQHRCKQPDK